ncbi:MAG: PIN domain-containing protein, partial [Elusimicrobiota bacterium]
MKRVFVDTSAWIAYVKRDDPDHEAVCGAVRRWEGRLLTSNFVFDETVTFLRARMGHAVAQRVGEAMRSMGLVRISGEDEEDAWAWFKQHRDKGYSYTD